MQYVALRSTFRNDCYTCQGTRSDRDRHMDHLRHVMIVDTYYTCCHIVSDILGIRRHDVNVDVQIYF